MLDKWMGINNASSRISAMLLDDDGCFDPLIRDADMALKMPEGVSVTMGRTSEVSTEAPAKEAFENMYKFITENLNRTDRRILYARLFKKSGSSAGWAAFCAHDQALLSGADFKRKGHPKSLVFEITPQALSKLRAAQNRGARLAFVADGETILSVVSLQAIINTPEPAIRLYTKK